MTADRRILGLKPNTFFQVFKYSVYFLIFIQIFYWLYEDYTASGHTFRDGVNLTDLGNAFAASVDTIAWFILLMTFELETYVLSDEKLKGRIKWLLGATAAACYFFIVVAFIGYVEKMGMSYGFEPVTETNACAFVGKVPSYAIELDQYDDLTHDACSGITPPLHVNADVGIVSGDTILTEMHRLAVTDVVNAGTWILIVLVLWIDVFLQLRGGLTKQLYKLNVGIKSVLYGTLIVCCGYWGWLGDIPGFWDALLWILAFFFIELNLFKWQEETAEETAGSQLEGAA